MPYPIHLAEAFIAARQSQLLDDARRRRHHHHRDIEKRRAVRLRLHLPRLLPLDRLVVARHRRSKKTGT